MKEDCQTSLTFAASVIFLVLRLPSFDSFRTSVGLVTLDISPTDILTYIMNSCTPAKLDVLKNALLKDRTFLI